MKRNASPQPFVKRPRPVVSCLNCRQKKLKCDRRLPCEKCVKGGRSKECEYAQGQEPLATGPDIDVVAGINDNQRLHTDENPAASSALMDLQARVRQLERTLTNQQASTLSDPKGKEVDVNLGVDETMSTSAHHERLPPSPSIHKLSSQFKAMRDFVNGLPENTLAETGTLASDVRCLHTRLHQSYNASHIPLFYKSTDVVLTHMEHLLPPENICHTLVELYFQYFENCTRILHRGTFWAQFSAYFGNSLALDNRESCTTTLFAIVSIASSLNILPECDLPALHSPTDGNGAYYLLRNYLDLLATEKWMELSTIQVALLTLKYHKSSSLTTMDRWNLSGQLFRRAMAAGMHLSDENDTDLFASEMSKRLYLSIMEGDLAFSIECGMPATCPVWQGVAPLNVDDDKLYPGMNKLPPNENLDKWTDGICQHVLSHSLGDRIAAYNAVAQRTCRSFGSLLIRTRHLEQIIQDLPAPFRFDPETDEASNTTYRLVAKMEFDLLVRRPLIACYAPYAALMPADDRYKEARIPWIQNCTIGVCFQDLFDPEYPTLDLPEPRGLWDYYHNIYKWNVEQFMLANCLELQRLSSLYTECPDTPSPAFHGHAMRAPVKVMGWSVESITHSLEDTIGPLRRRIGRHGASLRDVVRWTTVIGSLRASPTSPRQDVVRQELQALVAVLKKRFPLQQLDRFDTTASSDQKWLKRYLLQADKDDMLESS